MTMQNHVPLKPKTGSGPGTGTGWKLAYSINAMIEYETLTGKEFQSVQDYFEEVQGGKLNPSVLRRLVWCGLMTHHDGITEREAGAVIDACGINASVAAVGSAVSLAFAGPEDGAEDGAAGKPQAEKADPPARAKAEPVSTGKS
tara:strand:- start:4086 stop:4517 length:432 start_codon:yes stop_codon:yes gene_type:complete